MWTMKLGELIKRLQELDAPEDTEVYFGLIESGYLQSFQDAFVGYTGKLDHFDWNEDCPIPARGLTKRVIVLENGW